MCKPWFFLLLVALASTACVRVEFVPTGNTYPPTAPCNVEVFATQVPNRPYVEVGIIEGSGQGPRTSLNDMLPEMRELACGAGGHALILRGAQHGSSIVASSSSSGMSIASFARMNTSAVVIRWTDEEGAQ